MRATTNGRRYGLVKPRAFSLADDGGHVVVDGQNEPGAPRAFFQRARQTLVEKILDAPQHRIVRAAAQARPLLVGSAKGQE